MKVSVIIPVRDGERYIADAIGSVLEQTKPPAELLVVDDGSKDETATIVSQYSGSRSEEHTSELQSRGHLVCRLLLEKKKRSSLRCESRGFASRCRELMFADFHAE